MMDNQKNYGRCPNCNGELIQIKLISRGGENRFMVYPIDTELKYTANAKTKPSLYGNVFDVDGYILSFRCNSCHRIFLFGEDYEKDSK